jgi:predicted nucleotide-binding protein (sugar kinase/HSP70/actin superfamily)
MESSLNFRSLIRNFAKQETNKEIKTSLLKMCDQYREDLRIKGNIVLKVILQENCLLKILFSNLTN